MLDGLKPEIDEWISLWDCLHDAYVLSIEHGALERVAVVELKLGYPDTSAESRVTSKLATLRFCGTSHILLFLRHEWPGPELKHRQGIGKEEWNREIEEWRKKGHLQTASIDNFGQALSQDEAYILNARGSFGPNLKAIEFGGCFNGGESFSAFIAADSLSVYLDDQASSIEELLLQGESAWAAFHSK